MRPRSEVTLHLTKAQYDELCSVVALSRRLATDQLNEALRNPEFDPLLDERVIVGSSFKRGQG